LPFRSQFHQLFNLYSEIALGIFAAVAILLAVAVVWRRKRVQPAPAHRSEWTQVEGSYVLAVLGMAIFLVIASLNANGAENVRPKNAMVVSVTGFQWCWRFDYPVQHVSVVGSCVQGHDLPTMVLPTHTPIKLELKSNDVVHEFWVPYFDYKMELFPNHVNTFYINLHQTGRWIGRCAEFCGLNHTFMHFWVQGMSQTSFKHWLRSHHATSATI
jgi:cytochrome c oxidase subunit 2